MVSPRRLVGRQNEQQVLTRMLSDAREGRSGVVALRGNTGVGKTALLEYLLARATGFRALRIGGSESEMELAYAGLHQLCMPLLGRLDSLPVPQQHALRVALGLSAGAPPDRLIVGLAVLTLLSEASHERPTICVIDDAQWIDAASLLAILFVARRVSADPIVIVFAACSRREDRLLSDLPELQVRGLDDHHARALLAKAFPGKLNEQVRENIIAESCGNPLALLELHRVLSTAELAGGFGLAKADLLTSRLESEFGQRLGKLPAQAETLLLIAAADPTGEPRWLIAAAERLGIPANTVEDPAVADFIALDSRVRFRHPLIRSAVYRSSSASERRRVHQALAEVVDGPTSEEHRAWHLGHVATEPDEVIAEQLERTAELSRCRSGIAAAAAFLEFSADLTPDPRLRAQRVLAAAEAKLDAGAPESAAKLLVRARHLTDDGLLNAKIDLMRAKADQAAGHGAEAVLQFMRTANQLCDRAPELARSAYLEAFSAAVLIGRLATTGTSTNDVAVAARANVSTVHPAGFTDLLLEGLVARFADGYVAGAPVLRRALDPVLLDKLCGPVEVWVYDMAVRVSLELFDFQALCALAERQLEVLRGADALALLPRALDFLALADVFRGRFAEAAASLSEAEAIAAVISGAHELRSDALLAAYRGQQKPCREMTAAIIEGATNRHGQGFVVAVALFALAVLHNGLGQYAEALAACETALEYDDLAASGCVLVEAVEAATRCGDSAAAGAALTRLLDRAEAGATSIALGLAARSRALFNDGPLAEGLYLEAITHLQHSGAVVYLARTQLVYGEWLRRQGRRVDARAQLRAALDMFTAMGADGFADRARRELEATGETVRKRTGIAAVELTNQESHINRLARQGHTNAEIAAQLFISPRTVEWHMGKIFAKFGVTSRKELRSMEPPG